MVILLDFNNNSNEAFNVSFITINESKEENSVFLESSEEVQKKYEAWKNIYDGWVEKNLKTLARSTGASGSIPPQIDSKQQVENSFTELTKGMKCWASPIIEKLKESIYINADVLISAPIEILVLPWHLILSKEVLFVLNPAPILHRPIPNQNAEDPVKIFLIKGNQTGLNIQQFSNSLTNALDNSNPKGKVITSLESPSRQEFFQGILTNNDYHMLLFIGHSWTNKEDGVLYINESKELGTISIGNFVKTLDLANRGGLKLCFFCSCDGIGMASKLKDHDISTIIVFRAEVHEEVARIFLNQFLTAFSSGESLFESAKLAREAIASGTVQLTNGTQKTIEEVIPTASFLPMVFHRGVNEPILTWESLTNNSNSPPTSWAGVCRGMFKQKARNLVTNNPLAQDQNGFGFETIEINSSLTLKKIN